MANITGQITLNQISMLEVDADPAAGGGTTAPIGSMAIFNDGSTSFIYVKKLAANTAWNLVSSQAGALTVDRIPFSGSDGQLTSAPEFTWNDTSKILFSANGVFGSPTSIFPSAPLEVVGTNASTSQFAFSCFGNNAAPGVIGLNKSRGTVGVQTIVQDGDDTGRIQFRGSDGVDFHIGASVRGAVDGTPAVGSMPGRLVFYTTPNLSTNTLERMRITNSGRVLINTTTDDGSTQLQVTGRIAATDAIRPGTSTDTTAGNIRFNTPNLELFQDGLWRNLSTGNRSVTTGVQSTTSNVHSNVTELVSVSLAPGLYRVLVVGKFQSTAIGTGIGFRLVGGTATISAWSLAWDIEQAANGTDQDFQYKQVNGTINVTSASVVNANTDGLFQCRGIIEISVAGTVRLQFRSETNGTGVSVRTGSILSLEKI